MHTFVTIPGDCLQVCSLGFLNGGVPAEPWSVCGRSSWLVLGIVRIKFVNEKESNLHYFKTLKYCRDKLHTLSN